MRINHKVKRMKYDSYIKYYYNYSLVKIINLLAYMATHFHIAPSPSSICTWTFWIICLSVFRALCNWDKWLCLLMLVLHKLVSSSVYSSIATSCSCSLPVTRKKKHFHKWILYFVLSPTLLVCLTCIISHSL